MSSRSLKTSIGYLGPMLALWYMTGVSYSITSVSMGFLRPNITSNVVTLLCRNDTTNRYIANANFWVNSFTRVEDISYGNYTGINTSATIMLTPQDEGVYFCGVASQGIISSNDITLLAYPTEVPGSTHTFTVEVGQTVTLTCPFSKGTLFQYYTFSWDRGFMSLPNTNHRFVYGEETFDITIVDVTFRDNSSEYSCHVTVDPPSGNDWGVSSRPITLHVTNKTDKEPTTSTPVQTPTNLLGNESLNSTTKNDAHSISTTLTVLVATITAAAIAIAAVIVFIAVRIYRKRKRTIDLNNSRAHSMSSNASVRDPSLFEEWHANVHPLPISDQRTHTTNSYGSSLYMKPLLPSGDYPPTCDVQFVGSIQIVDVDRMGGEYRNPEHSISVRIPKDSFPPPSSNDDTGVRDSIELEIGIAIHGHFRFPEGVSPISAILWLNIAEEPEFEFSKDIEVDLPHYLQLSKSDLDSSAVADQLGCMLAVTSTDETEDDLMEFVQDDGATVHFKQRSGKIKTRRTCYMCLCAKRSFIEANSVYCLVSAVPRHFAPSDTRCIFFFVCYHLNTFVEVIKEEYKLHTITPVRFVFHDTPEDAKISIWFTENSASKGWLLTIPMNTTEVSAKAVELWENDVSDLRLRLQYKLYPPRVKVEANPSRTAQNCQEVFSFTGARYLDIDRQEFSMQVPLFVE